MKKGKLIVIDSSNDRIGKTTVLNMLTDKLDKLGIQWVTRHFNNPDSVPGQFINYLLDPESPARINSLTWKMVTQLYMIDFKDSMAWVEEQLNKGVYVILDRYYSSTVLYETAMMAQQMTYSKSSVFTPSEKEQIIAAAISIRELANNVYQLIKPDITFLIHADSIIEEFYHSVANQPDNLEGKDFQKYLIEIFKIITCTPEVASQVYDNPYLISRKTSDGKIVESSGIAEHMLQVISNEL